MAEGFKEKALGLNSVTDTHQPYDFGEVS
jgi:hypothetical protein